MKGFALVVLRAVPSQPSQRTARATTPRVRRQAQGRLGCESGVSWGSGIDHSSPGGAPKPFPRRLLSPSQSPSGSRTLGSAGFADIGFRPGFADIDPLGETPEVWRGRRLQPRKRTLGDSVPWVPGWRKAPCGLPPAQGPAAKLGPGGINFFPFGTAPGWGLGVSIGPGGGRALGMAGPSA